MLNGNYNHVSEVLRDVEVIWRNCRGFNDPGSDLASDADACKEAMDAAWGRAGLPRQASVGDGDWI